MLKILLASIPIVEFLYIFQSFEYERWHFLKWSFVNISRRRLQNKKGIVWTTKAKSLLVISLLLIGLITLTIAYLFNSNGGWGFGALWLAFVIVGINMAPIFLVLASWILWPLDFWQKQRIVSMAKEKRQRLKDLQVVGITGSFAKTSTKDILYTLLRRDYRVVKTPKSYNTLVAIARSLLRDVKKETEVFIVEMDAYHPGEIKQLAKLVTPNIGIITAIAPQHLERFGSIQKLAQAQFELDSEMINGKLVLNSKDEWSQRLSETTKSNMQWFGQTTDDDLQIKDIKVDSTGTTFVLISQGKKANIHLPLFGAHHAYNFGGAALVALHLGMSLDQIASRAKWLLPTPHRLEIKKMGNITIIDNSYNSNPNSYQASFELLKSLPGGQKVIVTPGLVELGTEHSVFNKQMGLDATKVADHLVIIGKNAREALLNGAKEGGMTKEQIHYYANPKMAINDLAGFSSVDAVVLIENDLPDQYL